MTDIWFSVAWLCFGIAYLIRSAYEHKVGDVVFYVFWIALVTLVLIMRVDQFLHPSGMTP